jgi:hypothetical protein
MGNMDVYIRESMGCLAEAAAYIRGEIMPKCADERIKAGLEMMLYDADGEVNKFFKKPTPPEKA